MGFTSYDNIINAISSLGQRLEWNFGKVSSAPEAAGQFHSLWTAAGTPGVGTASAGASPGTVFTNADGSINFANQSPKEKYLLSAGAMCSIAGSLMIYDRLVGVNVSVASTGNKTINTQALPRYTDGIDVQCWLEVTTATTTTAPIVNLNSYTNEAGTTGRSGGNYTFPATATNVDALLGPMPLQAGDKGIKSIEVGLNVGTAGATGIVNVLLLKPLAVIPCAINIYNQRDFVMNIPTMPRIYDGASLCLAFMASGTAAQTFYGHVIAGYV